MHFALIVLASAFLIESIGTFISVLGLASLFSASLIVISMAVALDIGKVVAVTFLYKFWKDMHLLMKVYMTTAVMVLMLITSAGVFGFLSAEFQKAISSTNEQTVLITALTDEQKRLQSRKEEIDAQIAQLPQNSVRGRTVLMKQFEPEVSRINSRLAEIDKELPQLKMDTIKKNVEVGPIMYISQAFGVTPEEAAKWVIFIIIFVFDPLAIALLLAGNFLLQQKSKPEETNVQPPPEEKVEAAVLPPKEESKPEKINDVIGSVPEPAPEPAPEPPPTFHSVVTPEEKNELLSNSIVEDEIDTDGKDVITLKSVNRFVHPSRSSLEDIDVTRVDVSFGDDAMNNFKNLSTIYTDR